MCAYIFLRNDVIIKKYQQKQPFSRISFEDLSYPPFNTLSVRATKLGQIMPCANSIVSTSILKGYMVARHHIHTISNQPSGELSAYSQPFLNHRQHHIIGRFFSYADITPVRRNKRTLFAASGGSGTNRGSPTSTDLIIYVLQFYLEIHLDVQKM